MQYDEAVTAANPVPDFFSWQDPQAAWQPEQLTGRGIQLGSTSREELERKIFKRNLNYFTNKSPDTQYSDFVMSTEDWVTLRSHHGDTAWIDSPEWRAFAQDTAALLDKGTIGQPPKQTDTDFFSCFEDHREPQKVPNQPAIESSESSGLGDSIPRELLEAQTLWEVSQTVKPVQDESRLSSQAEVCVFHGAILATFSLALVNSFGDSFFRLMNIYLTVSRSFLLFKMSISKTSTKHDILAHYLHRKGERLLWVDAGSLGTCSIVASLACLWYWANSSGSSSCTVSSTIEFASVAGVASSWCLGVMIARAHKIEMNDRESSRISAEYSQVDNRPTNMMLAPTGGQQTRVEDVCIRSPNQIQMQETVDTIGQSASGRDEKPANSREIESAASSEEEDIDELEFTHLEEEPDD